MREVINLQIGLCGNRVGLKFWEQIAEEHGIFPDGTLNGPISRYLNYIDTYFSANKDCVYKARSVNMDTDNSILDQLKCSSYGPFFKRENFVSGISGSSNNWAVGYNTKGCEMLDCCLDTIRREVELADCIQGFQILHSIGGGTGSGFTSLLLEHLDDQYLKKIKMTVSVLPSTKVHNNVIEPYNACLSMNKLSKYVCECVIVDNEALYDICSNIQCLPNPSTDDLNHLISSTLAAITSTFRFNSQPNIDFRKLYMSLVPFPNLNFYIPGFAPLFEKDTVVYRKCTELKCVVKGVLAGNLMAACDPNEGKFLTAATVFRGHLPLDELTQTLTEFYSENENLFVDWLSNTALTSVCPVEQPRVGICAASLVNTTAIHQVFQRLLSQYKRMHDKKAFLHNFTEEGTDECELEQCMEDVTHIIDEYKLLSSTSKISDMCCNKQAANKPAPKSAPKVSICNNAPMSNTCKCYACKKVRKCYPCLKRLTGNLCQRDPVHIEESYCKAKCESDDDIVKYTKILVPNDCRQPKKNACEDDKPKPPTNQCKTSEKEGQGKNRDEKCNKQSNEGSKRNKQECDSPKRCPDKEKSQGCKGQKQQQSCGTDKESTCAADSDDQCEPKQKKGCNKPSNDCPQKNKQGCNSPKRGTDKEKSQGCKGQKQQQNCGTDKESTCADDSGDQCEPKQKKKGCNKPSTTDCPQKNKQECNSPKRCPDKEKSQGCKGQKQQQNCGTDKESTCADDSDDLCEPKQNKKKCNKPSTTDCSQKSKQGCNSPKRKDNEKSKHGCKANQKKPQKCEMDEESTCADDSDDQCESKQDTKGCNKPSTTDCSQKNKQACNSPKRCPDKEKSKQGCKAQKRKKYRLRLCVDPTALRSWIVH